MSPVRSRRSTPNRKKGLKATAKASRAPRKRGPGRKYPELPEPAVEASAVTQGDRLQKVIANAGLGSRRQVEQWITEGKIRVNGEVAELGMRVTSADRVQVNGRYMSTRHTGRTRVLMYHKTVGELTSRSDPQGRPVVFDKLPSLNGQRWISVGRLDMNTSGMLLFTTDGELANRLMHPSSEVSREYLVRVLGDVKQQDILRVSTGVELEDGVASFDEIEPIGGRGANAWYRVVVREGKNRLVRRLWESQGFTVSRLKRSSYGPLSLPRDLSPGRWVELDRDQIKILRNAAKPKLVKDVD
ncbi:MAG: pseudouridine synthase [Immundisolibacteraceae bacterium]|nr:pseudouridine synthase [Immundisolibacteraceae bacterium]